MAKNGLTRAQVQQQIDQRVEQQVRQQVTGVQIAYSGPLPPPEILDQFGRIVPNGAERIFAQFEGQARHRQDLELRVIKSNTFSQRLGVIAGALLGLLGMGGAIFLLHEGRDVSGLSTLAGTLGSLVGVFIYAKKYQGNQLRAK